MEITVVDGARQGEILGGEGGGRSEVKDKQHMNRCASVCSA